MLVQNQLNRRTANALCTVIAFGFLSLDNQRVFKSNFLYQGDGDAAEIDRIKVLMQNSRIDGIERLCPDFERSGDHHNQDRPQEHKQDHPFIYAWRNGFDSAILQTQIDEPMQLYASILEQVFTMQGLNLRGAYIGGVANETSLELLVPSVLYRYTIPGCLDGDANYLGDVQRHYASSLETTNTVLNMFTVLKSELEVPEIQFPATIDDFMELVDSLPPQIGHNQTFASIHGLITSLLLAPPETLEEGNLNVELALTPGTNKVASCLPCAIFAMSQNAPASFTHFGRGDYWNLPRNCDAKIRYIWEIFVDECYIQGIELMRNYLPDDIYNFFVRLEQERVAGDYSYIPETFLLALTFPSSFFTKIQKTLEIINLYRGIM